MRGSGPVLASARQHAPSLSLRLWALPAKDSRASCTPWSVFQDGSDETPPASTLGAHCDRTFQHHRQGTSPALQAVQGRPGSAATPSSLQAHTARARDANSPRFQAGSSFGGPSARQEPPRRATQPNISPAARNRCWPSPGINAAGPSGTVSQQCFPPEGSDDCHRVSAGTPDDASATRSLIRFPGSGFTHCLTLFPKCFSPFPHGTCLLSVSHACLVLDGVYHPLWVAFPNSPTLRGGLAMGRPAAIRDGAITLSGALCHGDFESGARQEGPSSDYNSLR